MSTATDFVVHENYMTSSSSSSSSSSAASLSTASLNRYSTAKRQAADISEEEAIPLLPPVSSGALSHSSPTLVQIMGLLQQEALEKEQACIAANEAQETLRQMAIDQAQCMQRLQEWEEKRKRPIRKRCRRFLLVLGVFAVVAVALAAFCLLGQGFGSKFKKPEGLGAPGKEYIREAVKVRQVFDTFGNV